VVGAHLDSWDLGTGAVDDGFGVAAVLRSASAKASRNPREAGTNKLGPVKALEGRFQECANDINTNIKRRCSHTRAGCSQRGQRTGQMILFRIFANASLLPPRKLATEAANISSCVTRSHCNLIAGFHSQLSNEFTLTSPVSLAKRMQSVDLAKVVSGALAESLRIDPSQISLPGELASAVPLGCALVERKRSCPWRSEPCGILRPRRIHPGTDADGCASNGLSQRLLESGFRKARGVARRNGRFQTVSDDLHREFRQDCGGRMYPRADRDHPECWLLNSTLAVEASDRSCQLLRFKPALDVFARKRYYFFTRCKVLKAKCC
jgi:Peptidase family M28